MLTGVCNHIVLPTFPDSDALRLLREKHERIEIVELDSGEVIVTSFVRVSPHQADFYLNLRKACDSQRLDLDQLRKDCSK